jgi:hypothetical protein
LYSPFLTKTGFDLSGLLGDDEFNPLNPMLVDPSKPFFDYE